MTYTNVYAIILLFSSFFAESEGFDNYEICVYATHKRQKRLWNVA